MRAGVYGGVEAGGTKFVCAVGSGPDDIQDEVSIPTTTPDATISQALGFFKAHRDQRKIIAIGIGSFGPIDLNQASRTYGYITTTPKQGWAYTNLVGQFSRALKVPIVFDTDANTAALAESKWGAARDVDTFVYVTVGSGIGGGVMVAGRLLHGLSHPEIGHQRVPRSVDDAYHGSCSFHGDCLEGLAAGPALIARWGQTGENLPPGHPAWKLEAHYLALGLVNLILILSPQRIILGGGIMKQQTLLPMIRSKVQVELKKYLEIPAITEEIDEYIVPSALRDRAGVLGSIALAKAPFS